MNDLSQFPLPVMPSVTLRQPEIGRLASKDGIELYLRHWKAEPGLPVLVYLHGIEGHSQWIENTAAVLSARGIGIYAADRRGSGRSEGMPGDLNHYTTMLKDVEHLIHIARTENPRSPLVLFGNCWGAKVTTVMAQKTYKPLSGQSHLPIAGLILTCPALYTKVDLSIFTKFRIALDHLFGARRSFDIPLQPEMFTDNPIYLDYVKKDPLRLKRATSAFFRETLRLTFMSQKAASDIAMPVCLLQSGKDPIVRTDAVSAWFGRLTSEEKTMRLFPDSSHSLDFDANWFAEYTGTLIDWTMSLAKQTVSK